MSAIKKLTNSTFWLLLGLVLWINISIHVLTEFRWNSTLLPLLSVYPVIFPFIYGICKVLLYALKHHDWSEVFKEYKEWDEGPEKVNYTKKFKIFLRKIQKILWWILHVNLAIFQITIAISIFMLFFNLTDNPIIFLFEAFLKACDKQALLPVVELCKINFIEHTVKMVAILFYSVVSITTLITHIYSLRTFEVFFCFVVVLVICLLTFFSILKFVCFFAFIPK